MQNSIEITESIIDRVLETVSDVDERIKREQSRRPFNMNIIDELHANENAHTRILVKLLKYPSGGSYPILSSFLRMANDILSEDPEVKPINPDIKKPVIQFGQEFIDGLILGEGQGIIIENKIHYAVDQDAQIETYIKRVQEHGIKNDRIYVIYLTRNGSKEIQDYSLTEWAKGILKCDDEHTGRFIKMNYRDHIIKWLKEDILPNCSIKEDLLISAIKQYIDHLEGITRTRKNDNNMNEEIKRYLLKKLNVDSENKDSVWDKLTEERGQIQSVLDTIDNIRKEMSDAAFKQLADFSVEVMEDITSSSGEWRTYIGPHYIQILNNNWPDTAHFEWWPLVPDDFSAQELEIKFGFHLERNLTKKREAIKNEIIDSLKSIPEIQIFKEGNTKLKHGSALFEKTYYFGNVSFFEASEAHKKDFIRNVFSEYKDFIGAFHIQA